VEEDVEEGGMKALLAVAVAVIQQSATSVWDVMRMVMNDYRGNV